MLQDKPRYASVLRQCQIWQLPRNRIPGHILGIYVLQGEIKIAMSYNGFIPDLQNWHSPFVGIGEGHDVPA